MDYVVKDGWKIFECGIRISQETEYCYCGELSCEICGDDQFLEEF